MEEEKREQHYNINSLLEYVVSRGASDLHISPGTPPALRVDGEIYRIKGPPLTPADTQDIAYSVLNEKQRKLFEANNEVDISFKFKDRARFRANFFRQRGSIAGAMRIIPHSILALEQLGLPEAVGAIVDKPNGLVLVTGPTGSGKSTTLASMVHEINQRHRGHILTIEDPIEFLHEHLKCIVNQREVGNDTTSFAVALRYALRQDPDFVLIGEIRDRETMEIALRISETGHLTLATLHTNSTVQTIHRVLDFFPAEQQEMVRTQLSFVLQCIICQQLIPRADAAGRVLACELMMPNPAIRHLIRDDKTHQIYSQMQVGQKESGMMTMNQCLATLVKRKLITKEDAMKSSPDLQELTGIISEINKGS